MPVLVFITSGTTADGAKAESLIMGLEAQYLLADKSYDRDAVRSQAIARDRVPVIPPRKNRKISRDYDKALYRHRHWVGNAFLHLKRWRGIATR